MHPIGHAAVACGAAKVTEPLLRRAGVANARIDYRFAAFGAVLPDLVDKPLAWVLFPGTFDDSHLFGHTVLFGLSLLVLGLALVARRGDERLLLVGIGALAHLPVDPVAGNPSTLLWPLLGTGFDYAQPVIPYSIVVDFVLVVTLAAWAWRSELARERMRRFLMLGELSFESGRRDGLVARGKELGAVEYEYRPD